MVKVLVNGACGRMGQSVVKAVLADEELSLVAAVDIHEAEDAGTMVGQAPCGVPVTTNLANAIDKTRPDVMVDFTRPDVALQNAITAIESGVSPVIGTTGLSDDAKKQLSTLAEKKKTPCFIAPNFAIGAVLMMMMAKQAAKYMPNVEIIELHHDNKLDAPSGTALQTAELIREVRGDMRQGHPDEKETIPGARGAVVGGLHIHSVRLPGYVAHQEIIFGGLGQTLSIRHDSMDRESFMPGVMLACKKVRSLSGLVVGLEKLL